MAAPISTIRLKTAKEAEFSHHCSVGLVLICPYIRKAFFQDHVGTILHFLLPRRHCLSTAGGQAHVKSKKIIAISIWGRMASMLRIQKAISIWRFST
jgi:hypothetical protein